MKKFLAILPVLAACASAHAALFTFETTGLGANVTLSGYLNAEVFAGQLKFDDSQLGPVTTYCCDLDHWIYPGQSYNVNHLDSAVQTHNLELAGNILAAHYLDANDNDKAAGLQLAVWKATYDGTATADFSTGNVRATAASDIIADAESYYSAINTPGHSIYFKEVTGLTGQDQMMPTPEPASMAALAVGAVGLWRRKKRN